MMWNSVDLPQPDGPISVTNSPSATSNEKSSTAVTRRFAVAEALGDVLDGEGGDAHAVSDAMRLVRGGMEQLLRRQQPRATGPRRDGAAGRLPARGGSPPDRRTRNPRPSDRRAACNCSSMNGSVTLDAATSPSFASARAFDCSNAFIAATGSQGCCSASVRRMPRMCMIGNILDLAEPRGRRRCRIGIQPADMFGGR